MTVNRCNDLILRVRVRAVASLGLPCLYNENKHSTTDRERTAVYVHFSIFAALYQSLQKDLYKPNAYPPAITPRRALRQQALRGSPFQALFLTGSICTLDCCSVCVQFHHPKMRNFVVGHLSHSFCHRHRARFLDCRPCWLLHCFEHACVLTYFRPMGKLPSWPIRE